MSLFLVLFAVGSFQTPSLLPGNKEMGKGAGPKDSEHIIKKSDATMIYFFYFLFFFYSCAKSLLGCKVHSGRSCTTVAQPEVTGLHGDVACFI